MPNTDPRKAISGGIKGITQFVGTLVEVTADNYSDTVKAYQTHLLFTGVVIEKAGKEVELEDARYTEYFKQSEEPNSKWMKACEKWIQFGIGQSILTGPDDPAITSGELFAAFVGKRIRYLKIPIVQGNAAQGISPGLGFVPLKLIESDDEIEAPTFGHNAFSGDTISDNKRSKVVKKVSEEAIAFIVEAVTDDEGGLTAAQVETVCMDTAAHRAVVIRGGGVVPVLDACLEQGLLLFNGEVYLAPGSAALDVGESESDETIANSRRLIGIYEAAEEAADKERMLSDENKDENEADIAARAAEDANRNREQPRNDNDEASSQQSKDAV